MGSTDKITPGQEKVIEILRSLHGQATVAEIANKLKISKNSVSQMLGVLCKKPQFRGKLYKMPHPNDGIRWHLD